MQPDGIGMELYYPGIFKANTEQITRVILEIRKSHGITAREYSLIYYIYIYLDIVK